MAIKSSRIVQDSSKFQRRSLVEEYNEKKKRGRQRCQQKVEERARRVARTRGEKETKLTFLELSFQDFVRVVGGLTDELSEGKEL